MLIPLLSIAERSRKKWAGMWNWTSSTKTAFSGVIDGGRDLPSLSSISVFP